MDGSEPEVVEAFKNLEDIKNLTQVSKDLQAAMYALLAGREVPAATKARVDLEVPPVPVTPPGGTPPPLPPPPPVPPAGGGTPPTSPPPVGGTPAGGLSGGITTIVNLLQVSNSLQMATHVLLSGPSSARTPTGGGTSGGPSTALEREARDRLKAKAAEPKTAAGRLANSVRGAMRWPRQIFDRAKKIGRGAGRKIGGAIGMRGAGGAIGGFAGGAVGGVAAVAAGFYEANKAVSKWTDAALDSAAKLGEVSGSMAAIAADREIRQIQRDIEKGESTAKSTEALMESEDRRKNATLPIEIAIDNLQNTVLSTLNDVMTPVITQLGKAVGLLDEVTELLGGEKGEPDHKGLAFEFHDTIKELNKLEAVGRAMMDDVAKARKGGVAAPAGAAGAGANAGGFRGLPPA